MKTKKELEILSTEIRTETLKCLRTREFGHVGGCLSVVEVLAVLYGSIMKYDPENPTWEGRDRFVMCKGHAGPALFATLALKGFFPMEWLDTLSIPGTKLPSHCDRNLTPGVDASTGSLGQGLSVALGMAHGLKIQNQPNRVYAILGDGECGEGQVWEAAQYAHHHQLGNVIAFVDWNKKQVDGTLDEVMSLLDVRAKFEAFGWYAVQVGGSDVMAIQNAILEARKKQGNKPAVIVLDGIKGSGVPEFEQMEYNHHFAFEKDMIDKVIRDLENKLAAMKEE